MGQPRPSFPYDLHSPILNGLEEAVDLPAFNFFWDRPLACPDFWENDSRDGYPTRTPSETPDPPVEEADPNGPLKDSDAQKHPDFGGKPEPKGRSWPNSRRGERWPTLKPGAALRQIFATLDGRVV